MEPWRPVVGRWSIPVGLACMVVAFAAGSSSSTWAKKVGLDARWFVLLGVAAVAGVVALGRIWTDRKLPSRGLLRVGAFAAAFLALAVVSAGWSVAPRLSLERAVSLALLFTLAAALASTTASDAAARLRVLQGLAAGAIAVGILGLLMLAVDYDAAVQQVDPLSPWRFRGFTENPNTISILAAASVPIITGLAIRATGRPRALWTAGALLLIGSTVAAESRGPLLAAFMGVCVVFLLAFAQWRARLVGVTASLLVFIGGIALREVTQPPQAAFTSAVVLAPSKQTNTQPSNTKGSRPGTTDSTSTNPSNPGTQTTSRPSGQGKGTAPNTKPGKAKAKTGKHKTRVEPSPKKPAGPPVVALPRAEDEIGNPLLTKKDVSTAGSGRVAAWRGALELIRDRPILGYGFGTESRVFVDRWYYFQGGSTENSYLGLLLQVGALGLALVLALGLALLTRGLKTIPAIAEAERPVMAALLGVLVSAAGIMLIQSFLYSVGNIATATVWISLFLLGTVVLEPRRQRKTVLVPAREERGALVA